MAGCQHVHLPKRRETAILVVIKMMQSFSVCMSLLGIGFEKGRMVDSAVVFAACFSADWYKFSKKIIITTKVNRNWPMMLNLGGGHPRQGLHGFGSIQRLTSIKLLSWKSPSIKSGWREKKKLVQLKRSFLMHLLDVPKPKLSEKHLLEQGKRKCFGVWKRLFMTGSWRNSRKPSAFPWVKICKETKWVFGIALCLDLR